MSQSATVDGGGRLRLFCALTLPEPVLDVVVEWQARTLRGGRIVPRGNLHVTLAFLGSRPHEDVVRIAGELRAAAVSVSRPIVLRPRAYRETRSVGMVAFDDEEGRATALAGDLFERLEQLGVYERERRPWLPHVTVLRFRSPPRLRPDPPGLGEVSPSGAAVYHSVLRSGGAQYETLDFLALRTPPGG